MDDLHDEPKGNYYPLAEHGSVPINLSTWHFYG